jgi:hypothetical protein
MSRRRVALVATLLAMVAAHQSGPICMGQNHACAVFTGTDAGKLKCWGSSTSGRSGQSTTMGNSQVFSAIPFVALGTGSSGAAFNASQVACGMTHTCVLSTEGEIKCCEWQQARWGKVAGGGVRAAALHGQIQRSQLPDVAPMTIAFARRVCASCTRWRQQAGLEGWGCACAVHSWPSPIPTPRIPLMA